MVQCSQDRFDLSFAALSDATRRGVLEELGRRDASITDLAEKFHMSLTGMKKHVGVLERAWLVTTVKAGRVRTCRLGPRQLEQEAAWIASYRRLWDERFHELDKVVEERNQRRRSMDATRDGEPSSAKNCTDVERTSEREMAVTRTFNGPARLVYEAWTNPELIRQWWVPKSFGASFLSCEIDARTGGTYRFVFSHASSETPLAFFGKYLDVAPEARLVWTNEESGEGGPITTVTFKDREGRTLVVSRDVYSSKEALDDAVASGATGGSCESFEQLDALLIHLGVSAAGDL